MGLNLSAESQQVLVAFGCYLVGVMVLGILSHRYLSRGSFVKEYFIGNRGLGPWVLALSVAATAISGGTFMGFPSLIYSNGWVMALWIASYMVVPLTTMALMGKRLNQVARVSGAVTVPDVFRDRFGTPALGVTATLLILFFLTFNLVAQFKAGALVLKEAIGLPPESITLFPSLPLLGSPIDKGYLLGLLIFAGTVVGYTTYGGFWAVTWTDVLEGLVMLVGVVLMAWLAIRQVPPVTVPQSLNHTETAAPIRELHGLAAATESLRQQDPRLVYGPGPNGYLPLGMAFSFFLMWSLMSPGQPSSMVRLMAFKDASAARRALLLVCGYYLLTYTSLLVIFICARAMFPTQYLLEVATEGVPDSIMPAMTRKLASPLVAGLLLAAPYAAIMSTVAAFLLMISSSLVRDIYQRCINPDVPPRTIKIMSYGITAVVGIGVVIAALHPPDFLQYIIVFSGSGLGCSFLIPMMLLLYWRRATAAGTLAGMLGGFSCVLGLYALGWLGFGDRSRGQFAPLYLGDVDPLVWGLLASLVLGVAVSVCTKPDAALTRKYFPPVGR